MVDGSIALAPRSARFAGGTLTPRSSFLIATTSHTRQKNVLIGYYPQDARTSQHHAFHFAAQIDEP